MKIKLKEDLPGIKAGSILTVHSDRLRIYTGHDAEIWEINIRNHPDFFEIIEEPKFGVGDWVWDAHLGRAEKIRTANSVPEYCPSLDWAMLHPKRYPRFATREEIRSVTEKEDELIYYEDSEYHCYPIIITRDKIIHTEGTWHLISELKRIISIAENLQEP